ncbi:High-affinity nitrate transporter 2.1 [Cladochytrium tenue]|nr:High-affinity nitrate transporter 2.1 [Cladochytrium tenue]
MRIPVSIAKNVYIGTNVRVPLELDDEGKAKEINLLSSRRVHMRAFHLSWLGFFAAFTGWFAITALISSIKMDTGITDAQASTSDVTNVASTVIFRFFVGPLVDHFGARRVMALVLGLGAIPLVLAGLVSSGTGLIVARFFVGLLGAAFVPCQYWTQRMFADSVVGSANAIAAGWGNMGAGFTYLVMPQFFNMFTAAGVSSHNAWRATLAIPATFCVVVGILCLMFGDDMPARDENTADGEQSLAYEPRASTTIEKGFVVVADKAETASSVSSQPKSRGAGVLQFLRLVGNPSVLILMFMYACSFGVELSVDSKLGTYLTNHFKRPDCVVSATQSCTYLSQSTAGLLGSTFGLMNLFSRAAGGVLSDWAASRHTSPSGSLGGRMLVQMVLLLANGVALVAFSFINDIRPAIAVLILFSLLTEATCGSTYALVPFVDPHRRGTVSGLVGAGGNIGGAIFNVIFAACAANPSTGFLIMGSVVFASSISVLMLKIQGVWAWSAFSSLWDVTTGRLLRTLKAHSGWVNSVAFSSDSRTVVSGSEDKTIKLWEVAAGMLVRTLEGNSSVVHSVAFSSDGGTVASGSRNCTIRLRAAAADSGGALR